MTPNVLSVLSPYIDTACCISSSEVFTKLIRNDLKLWILINSAQWEMDKNKQQLPANTSNILLPLFMPGLSPVDVFS